jgi:uridylate kinase
MKKKSRRKAYPRIILKLSGEFFGKKGTSFNQSAIQYTVGQITKALELGTKIGIVVGGGNIIRGHDAQWLNKIDADVCGMMGTMINGLMLHSVLDRTGFKVKISSALAVDGVVERFNKFRDQEFYDKGGIVLFVGGTGNPLFTTDTAAALRAAEFSADMLIKGTKVAGVYSSDPHKNKHARFYKRLTYDQAISKNLEVMDMTAFNICRQADIPICVYDFMQHELCDIIAGEMVGTIIDGGYR